MQEENFYQTSLYIRGLDWAIDQDRSLNEAVRTSCWNLGVEYVSRILFLYYMAWKRFAGSCQLISFQLLTPKAKALFFYCPIQKNLGNDFDWPILGYSFSPGLITVTSLMDDFAKPELSFLSLSWVWGFVTLLPEECYEWDRGWRKSEYSADKNSRYFLEWTFKLFLDYASVVKKFLFLYLIKLPYWKILVWN